MNFSKTQPFCDVNVSGVPIDANEYVDILNDIKKNCVKDIKFSDTEVKITTLTLYKMIHYNAYCTALSGLKKGYATGFFKGVVFGSIITLLLVFTVLQLI